MNTKLERNHWIIGLLALVVLLVSGCAKPPDQELSGAEVALGAAEDAEAATYASTELEAARQDMDAVRTELTAQNGKMALLRKYDQAKTLIDNARRSAEAAKTAAVAGKAKALAEAEAALEGARNAVQQAYDLHTALGQCPRRPKGFAVELESLKASIDGIAEALPDVERALSEERFSEAQDLAAGVVGGLAPILSDMENAKAEIGC